MLYRVTARFKADTTAELCHKLNDGSIAAQQPDGREIVDSLHRAVVTASGEVIWSEQCYCDPPLAHERATVLDRYFSDIATEAIENYERYDGLPFTHYLAAEVETPARRVDRN